MSLFDADVGDSVHVVSNPEIMWLSAQHYHYTHNSGGKIDAPVPSDARGAARPTYSENHRQADFFCGKLNRITFPYSSGGIHFGAFFEKLLGTKNSMIFAINHPTCKNKTEAKKFLTLTNLYRCLQADSPEDIRQLSLCQRVRDLVF